MLKLLRKKTPKEFIASSEFLSSNFMPYKMHVNERTVLLKDDSLLQVIKVSGFSFETADDEDLDIRKTLRNQLFKSLGGGDFSFYFHLIRLRKQVYPKDYASVDMPDGFALYLDQKWVDKHRDADAFVNEIYISIVRPIGMSSSKSFIGKLLRAADTEAFNFKMREACESIDEASTRVLTALKNYSPELLSVEQTGNVVYSEIAEFLSKLVNGGEASKIPVSSNEMSTQLNTSRLYFGNKTIEFKPQNGQSKYAAMVSIKEYGPKTWVSMMDPFLRLPNEFILTQSFQFTNKRGAISAMQTQQRLMIQAEDKAASQIVEIDVALDMAMSGEIAFGKHHLSVMCFAPNPKELEEVASVLAVELSNTGGIGGRETTNLEPAFWGQLPGNFGYILRKATINTLNLSAFASFHNYPVGKAKNNHWGDAVTVLDTTSGTPFYFNFHVRDVGHTTIIGPTGAGKTVLMNFLCAQAQKFKCRLFFFDKDRGAEIFIRALSGQYTIIDPGKVCGFNPLQLEDTGENRTFLLDWMKQLVTVNKENVSSEDIYLLTNAIAGNFKLDPKDRKLSNIMPFLGMAGPGTLAGRMGMWAGKGSHAKVFDNEVDTIDFGKANIFGFEMAELLKDSASLGPCLSYIFHRINLALDGTPTMIVLDEAWALIDNPVFAPKIKDWLKVLRKLNTFVIFATQSVEDASKSAISDTLIQQTATQIFLPNLRATDVYRKTFMLSEREHNLIKTTDPGTRFFLVKQGNDSVIARVDLSGMSDVVNVLSGRADTVIILDEVRKKHGDDPNVWIPIFNQKLKELRD
jgi:type IV secretion system protein VirB4